MTSTPPTSIDEATAEASSSLSKKRLSGRGLPELRRSQLISDGACTSISNSSRALAFSCVRVGNHSPTATTTYIASLIDDLQTSLRALGADPPLTKLEEWAILIHECLSSENRNFHSVHHVFEITTGSDPIQLLAAFFRDLVNSVTDGSLPSRQEAFVGGIFKDNQLISEKEKDDQQQAPDRLVQLLLRIFGFESGQTITEPPHVSGVDIFLSAVMMARVLQDTLSETDLVQIAVCMEATIPFRRNSGTRTALDALFERLTDVNTRFALNISQEDLIECIQRAADLNNRNLGNFASEDAVFFLDHTWSLLPERSSALRRSCLYSVNEMQKACWDMEQFLSRLDTTVVFQSFRDIPNKDEMEHFQQRLGHNIQKGQKYMRAQLLSVSVVAALATLSGGDGPMSFFTGDLPTFNYHSDRLGDDLPLYNYQDLSSHHVDYDVYIILNRGRELEQSFDTRNSPLAAYLYGALGDHGVKKALHLCEFPMTAKLSRKLLKHLPQENVKQIVKASAKLALSRTEILNNLLVELFGEEPVP